MERINENFVEKLTVNDILSLASSDAKQEGTENSHSSSSSSKIKDTDQMQHAEVHGLASSTSPELHSTENEKLTSAIAFSIPVGNTTTSIKCPPKRLLAGTKQHKEKTLESLKDKQILAERRRKQQRERKLQRIHARQEDARKLAEKVDILLQQRALAMGMVDGNIKRLPSSQLLATANQVAHNFRDLTNQLDDDFTVKGEKKTQGHCSQNKKNENNNCLRQQKKSQNLSFTVPIEEITPSKTPVSLTKQKKKVTTKEELEEKQRQAEDRRKKRMERRVTRCRENREALMKMAKDIEKFETLQASPDPTQSKETAVLAERIANGFERLKQRYDEDLRRADNIEQPYVLTLEH